MFHEEFQTDVVSVVYDWSRRVGVVILAAGVTDMEGTVAFFTRIDPEVEVIVTTPGVGGDRRDGTTYRRIGDQWKANVHVD